MSDQELVYEFLQGAGFIEKFGIRLVIGVNDHGVMLTVLTPINLSFKEHLQFDQKANVALADTFREVFSTPNILLQSWFGVFVDRSMLTVMREFPVTTLSQFKESAASILKKTYGESANTKFRGYTSRV